ncbi:germinal-center associated nuclear protein-like [Dendronephthya gigantea]|uniref:germinal-center associated nuclear protein-like n=1 Tax=Dendronephthya gigantea TaxID=151771 RepID=UPI00106BA5D4|nr:germinal-center associated nuclear protein-like [Dendronephthya gigantea]
MAASEEPKFLQGLCMEMCPNHERMLREKQKRLHPFERVENGSDTDMKQPVDIVVKKYSRPAAGKQLDPNNLRPASVLVKTMNYLMTDVLNKPHPWYYKYGFISDRIRSIRQDLTAQNIQSFEAIDILEKATRYYLIMAVKLSQEPLENYDPILHYTHLKECLRKLLDLYQLHNKMNKSYNQRRQASFEACNLILNLRSADVYYLIIRIDDLLKECKEIQLAIHLIKLHLNGNFIGLFRAASKLPSLESCAFFCHIQPIRCKGLSIMNTAFSSKNLSYPLALLVDNFCFDSGELAAEFCATHNILVNDGKVFFNKGQFVKTNKHKSCLCHKLVGAKIKDDISDMITC